MDVTTTKYSYYCKSKKIYIYMETNYKYELNLWLGKKILLYVINA